MADLAERQAHHALQQELLKLLSLKDARQEGARIPCNNLPVAKNSRFFGRQDTLTRIDNHLKPEDTLSGLSSIAIHGLGGVGKTQTAQAYAYSKLDTVDAVFWVSADTALSIQQGFSHIATDALQLPDTRPQSYQENMLRVLNWLQKTCMIWTSTLEKHTLIQLSCYMAADLRQCRSSRHAE